MTTIEDLWDDEFEQEQLAVIVERRYGAMLSALHSLIADALGLDAVVQFRLDDAATRAVLEHAAERVVRISDTTRDAIREHLQEGQRLGLSGWEIANGSPKDNFPPLDRLFDETWKGRADLISRTELAEAQRVSALNRYAASGLVDQVRVVDGDYDAFCASRNGKVVPLAEAPDLAHPACRLVVIPVVREASA